MCYSPKRCHDFRGPIFLGKLSMAHLELVLFGSETRILSYISNLIDYQFFSFLTSIVVSPAHFESNERCGNSVRYLPDQEHNS